MPTRLVGERLKRNWSQSYVAIKCDVDQGTVSRWERDISMPTGESRRRLCELFGMTGKELGLDGDLPISQDSVFAQDPIARLVDLPYTPVPRSALSSMIRKLSEDTMNLPSRRSFLKGTLASIILLPLSSARSATYEHILYQCSVGLVTAQELYRSNQADDLRLAYDAMIAYSSMLATIAQNSPRLRAQAIELLAGCSILKMRLGWHCDGDTAAILLGKDALALSEEAYKASGDAALWLSAYSKLAWAYSCKDEVESAYKTACEAEQLLSSQPATKIHDCIRAGTYSTLAMMQARNHIDSKTALGKANEIDPGTEVIAFMSFTRADQIREKAIVLHYAGDHAAVPGTLSAIVDPETLVLSMPQSERERVEAIKTLADSSLATRDRDMEQIIGYWIEMVQSAHARQSKSGLGDAMRTYERMKIAFPGEQRVLNLRSRLISGAC